MQIKRLHTYLVAFAGVIPVIYFLGKILPTPVFSDEIEKVEAQHARDVTDIWIRQLKGVRETLYTLERKEYEAEQAGLTPSFYAKERAVLESEIEQLQLNIKRAQSTTLTPHARN